MGKNTKQRLSAALVTQLQRTPVDKITIKSIVDACDLTRQTFYNHFSDIYELVEWTAKEATAESLKNVADYDNWQHGFYNVMVTIKANRYLVENTYQSAYRDLLEKYIYAVLYRYIIAVVERQAVGMQVAQKHKDFIAHFYSLAFIALIFEWVKDGLKEDPGDIVEQTGVLIQGDFKKALHKYAE
ncbi:TetR-like C-terminal domain-containing protein [Levilactobacillus parabrevis]|uniref:TetR family transcriptional regulator n=1 Tax=Levilactobacillus parabrevis ATCC 53295 TaxID=1267003 RepID=A0A0R1GZ96_9LACO|nr:TetR-like C-terminal domain-containing protein [Levilactobacillus parabrevis]KRK39525.1 TetR family transcriptional regulator [Levilactobacillus parabrevis ATCC 53295]KRO06871.1 TetR family transcriptional regulator [Levilactobacillus parabrevis]